MRHPALVAEYDITTVPALLDLVGGDSPVDRHYGDLSDTEAVTCFLGQARALLPFTGHGRAPIPGDGHESGYGYGYRAS